jgi:uncharacterized protein (TIGR03435 family)
MEIRREMTDFMVHQRVGQSGSLRPDDIRSGFEDVMKLSLFILFAVTALHSAEQPKFETASVKRASQCEFNTSIDPGSVTLKGVPLKGVLREAFKVRMEQIEGPSWLDADCFEILAKIPEGATSDQVPAMLQSLLVDRFKLASHMEDRQIRGYALVVDKGGPRVKETMGNLNLPGRRAGTVFFRAGLNISGVKASMSMAGLARYLSGVGYGPVEDQTGLTGKYDVDLTWAPDRAFEPVGPFAAATGAAQPDAAQPPDPAADLFTAVRESLGLGLDARKISVQYVVIDHIERVPTEN